MKRNILHTTRNRFIGAMALMATVMLALCGCSEELFTPSATPGEKTTISLSYADVSPREININTRADDPEKHLDNLYIYIFDADGDLIGYKGITSSSELNQNTSNSSKAEISGIKTRTGQAYIYAVANVTDAGTYTVESADASSSYTSFESGKLPIGFDEEKAQNGDYNFTKDNLMSLLFNRNEQTIQMSNSLFVMSGSVNKGELTNIISQGNNSGKVEKDSAIRLNRIVAKINFKIAVKTDDNIARSFSLSSYDIMNIPLSGQLVGSYDKNTTALTDVKYNNETGRTLGVNDDLQFSFYLPENLQVSKNSVSAWVPREQDDTTQTNKKVFVNAPENGTYVVLKGKYEETNSTTNITRNADVTYYIHLGEWSDSQGYNIYNVERNCNYTYNVTVAGVNKIIVEAKKQGNDQPGAEGVVLEYGSAGKNLLLDSHYEYMVMRFYKKDIDALKQNNHGYSYQISDINGTSGIREVKGDDNISGNLNNASTDWIEFAIGGTYSTDKTAKGTPFAYPGKNSGKLYTIDKFLQYLYNKSDWSGTSGSEYIDATCFVDENYYPSKTWDQYVNDVPKRYFYIANDVKESTDKRSIYASVAYGLQQYNIQTFYDRSQSGTIVAYGCETINDEKRSDEYDGNKAANNTNDKWDGRKNFMNDYKKVTNGTKWSTFDNNKELRYRCLSRNRDLNGDGTIDDNEARWYVPTSAQYAGLWIGEDIISTEAKLYNEKTTAFSKFKNGDKSKESAALRMIYYTNTNGEESFWSEEGMATGQNNGNTRFVRCIRNLKSNDDGYDKMPATYFTWDSTNKLITLDKVDAGALNVTGSTSELIVHNEREEANKPASKFYVAGSNTSESTSQENVYNGTNTCKNYSQENKSWRVPNQREYCLMFLVAGNSSYNGLEKSDLSSTFVKTKFSGWPFRYSWYCNGSDLTMSPMKKNGYIRCISPVK